MLAGKFKIKKIESMMLIIKVILPILGNCFNKVDFYYIWKFLHSII